MAIELVEKYLGVVDEKFATESKHSLVTNKDIAFTGANTVKIYKVSTGTMNDYGRSGPAEGNWSRYGEVETLSATTEEMTLKKDRSFTFVIDAMDEDETALALSGATALERQIREVVIPEVDSYVFGVMADNAGTAPEAKELTAENIYDEIITGTLTLDNAEVPENERVLIVSPATYYLMKQCGAIIMETETGSEMRLKGVIGDLDGMKVMRVPSSRLPKDFGFMIAHPSATVAPEKLASFRLHVDPPGLNGTLAEGRIYYDAFVLDNKADGIYYQALADDSQGN